MQKTLIPYKDTNYFSDLITDYLEGNESLRQFYHYTPELASFTKAVVEKSTEKINRKVLHEVLKRQYARLQPVSERVNQQIERMLSDDTYVVVTAHQLNICTGPLYTIYKALSAIRISEELNRQMPDKYFIPLYWLGTEDHDFEEINHVNLFGKNIVWHNDQEGATGRMDTATMADFMAQVKEIAGNSPNAEAWYKLLEEAYTGHPTLGEAHHELLHELLGQYGMLMIEPDDPAIKSLFSDIVKKELFEQFSSPCVEKQTEALEAAGYHMQAYPRDINMFYLKDELRSRIVYDEKLNVFSILNTDLKFSKEEMTSEIDQYPERFSPNVILRPLFQQSVLPAVAYVGGGGEVAYWLQLKQVFESAGVNFPVLFLRNSLLVIDSNSASKMEKLGLDEHSIFRDTESLLKGFVKSNSENKLELTREKKELSALFEGIIDKVGKIDSTLIKTAKAEQQNILNSFERFETKLLRAEKQRFEVSLNQIKGLKERLFPGDGLQERTANLGDLYIRHGAVILDELMSHTDPFEPQFTVLKDN